MVKPNLSRKVILFR